MEEIKQGYKQTDIGLIPEDWNLSPVRNLGVFSKGSGISRAESNTGILPSIRYGEIYTVHNDYIKKFSSFISTEVAKKAKRLKCGDILFTASGETKEDIGKCVAFFHDIEAYAGGDIIILSPRNANSLFLGFLFNAPYVVKQKANKGQGDAIVHITKASVGDITVALPESVNEQTAIATALSNTDALIAAMDKKIAKKQQIKQGAMQQLLTGKKRLPGFNGENKYKETEIGLIPEDWDIKPLDKLANIIDPHPSHRAPMEFTNGIPFLGIGDFNENGDIIKSTYRIVSKSIYTEHNLRYNLNDGLLGLGRVASIGKVIKFRNNVGEFTISPTMGVLKPTLAKRDYLFQILKSEFATQYFAKIMNGSTRSSVGMIVLRRVLIPIPQDESEQSAIAQILTDMDQEISRLEKERDKYVQLKAGMMQVLLTGKVRLVNKNAKEEDQEK